MKKQLPEKIENARIGGESGWHNGAFIVKRGSAHLRIISSNGMGWDHVSVSLATRCPTWEEMCWVKDQFFEEEEVAMQLHPAKSQWINNHNFCLHLWRAQPLEEMLAVKSLWESDGEPYPYEMVSPGQIPLPPPIAVGFK